MPKPDRLMVVNCLLLLAALACSTPSVQPTAAPTSAPPSATPTPAPTSTPIPTLEIPPDWKAYPAVPGINLALPPGWEVSATDPAALDIRADDGEGWMQIVALGGTGTNPFGLAYSPGMAGDAIMASLLAASRQDGTFADPQMVATRAGVAAWLSEGRSDVHHEQVLIAAVGLPDRALVLIGHGGQNAEDWPALSEIFRGIVASLSYA